MKKFIITYLFISISYIFCVSQKQINLEQAISLAKINNSKILTDKKYVDYQKALINSSSVMDPLQINTESGQFNSIYFDFGLGVSQSFLSPKYYKTKKILNEEKVKSAEAMVKVSEISVIHQMNALFSEWYYLMEKDRLLKYQDSIFFKFQEKANLRLIKGETDLLEKTTADQQRFNITQQIKDNEKAKYLVILNLNWLINHENDFIPASDTLKILNENLSVMTTPAESHPMLFASAQELSTAKATTDWEKTALLPQYNLGYRNVGIRGTGADNKIYGFGTRFNSVQIGVNIPIFTKGIKSNINGAKMMEEVKIQEYTSKLQELQVQIQQQTVLYNETMQQIQVFKNQSLPNAGTIRSVGQQKYDRGEINYLEYVILINQAIQTENDYIDLIYKVNSYIINLNYLTSNNQ
jgi:cobalt-zinc-cadmium resistance protein CzcA